MELLEKSSMAQSLPKNYLLREYRIDRLLSVETDSFVYLAETGESKRLVTIKEHFPVRMCERSPETGEVVCLSEDDIPAYEESLNDFETLTLSLSRLIHPGVPRQLRLFGENGTLYRVAQYGTGYALTTLLKRRNECDWFFVEVDLRDFLWRVLEILKYIHENGVYHCDLKPKYIVFTRLGNPLLTHFCSGRELDEERRYSSDAMDAYLAPEQWTGAHPCDARTDIYSTGALFYRIITGSDPISADKRKAGEGQALLAEDETLKKSYTKPFLQWIDKAMSLEAGERFKSAEEWQKLIEHQRKFLKPFWVHGMPKGQKRKKSLWVLVLLMLFLGGLWGAYSWVHSFLEIPQPEPVIMLATELSTKGMESRPGRLWGFAFQFKDYGFGVNAQSLPPVVSLSSLSFEGTEIHPLQAAPPVRLAIKTEEGVPLAISQNAHAFSKPGKVDFTFEGKVTLSTSKTYQYVFLTEEGASIMVDLKLTRKSPLDSAKASAYGYDLQLPGAVPQEHTIPLFTVSFSPDSGASPLVEALESAQVAQSRGYADPRNWCLHPGATAIQSSVGENADAVRAIDGQMSGEMGCMTDPAKGKGWWLVSFGKGVERPVQKVILYNMQESGSTDSRRLSNFRVSLFDRKGKAVVSKDFYTEEGAWLKETAESWDLDRPYFAHSVRVEKLGKGAHPEDAALYLAEVEAIAPSPLTKGKTPEWKDWCSEPGVKAQQSSIWRNWISTYGPHRAIDSQNDERFFVHTATDNTPGWWEVDLGAERPVDCVQIDNCLIFGYDALRLSNYRVILYKANGEVARQNDFFTTPGDYAPDFVYWKLPEVTSAKKVRIEKLGKGTHPYDNALSLKKVRVLGIAPASSPAK